MYVLNSLVVCVFSTSPELLLKEFVTYTALSSSHLDGKNRIDKSSLPWQFCHSKTVMLRHSENLK